MVINGQVITVSVCMLCEHIDTSGLIQPNVHSRYVSGTAGAPVDH